MGISTASPWPHPTDNQRRSCHVSGSGMEMRGGPPGGDRGIPLPGTDVRRGTDGVRSIAPSATARAQRGVARVACGRIEVRGNLRSDTHDLRAQASPTTARSVSTSCHVLNRTTSAWKPAGRAYPSGRPGVAATGRLLRFPHPVRAVESPTRRPALQSRRLFRSETTHRAESTQPPVDR